MPTIRCRDCTTSYLCAACTALLARAVVTMPVAQTALSERTFQGQVLAAARQCGWLAYHTQDSRGSAKGFPDLVLAKSGHPLYCWELKTKEGKTTTEQQHWLHVLPLTGPAQVGVYRPADLEGLLAVLARQAKWAVSNTPP